MIANALRELGARVLMAILALVFCAMLIGVPGVFFIAALYCLGPLPSPAEGFVREPASGQVLELTGVPGDQIKLRFPVGSHAVQTPGEFYATFRDAESQFETTLPVVVEAHINDDRQRLFGRILVPGVPGRPAANLTGTLWGHLKAADGGQQSLEIPLNLQLAARGEGTTSGAKDVTLAKLSLGLVLGLGALTIVVATTLLYASATALEELPDSRDQAAIHWRIET